MSDEDFALAAALNSGWFGWPMEELANGKPHGGYAGTLQSGFFTIGPHYLIMPIFMAAVNFHPTLQAPPQ